MDIHSRFLRTDVTAVIFFKKHVIAGMGCGIIVYDVITTNLVAKIDIFHGQKVHGICAGTDKHIAIFGGRFVAVLEINLQEEAVLLILSQWQLDDWILCLQWLPEDNTIAIATAHNVVSLWNWKVRERLVTAYCEEKCILYSALFVGSSWQDLILLAGTVFQEIVVWSPLGAKVSGMDSPVLHRMKGHQGVIFSIYYNPHTRRVYTTSDDRSVRAWKVNADDANTSNAWCHVCIDLLHTLFGHTARVWRSVGLDGVTISIGEDSQLCIWSADGRLLKRWMTHQGGCVWSVDCSQQNNLIVTGGGDGGISLWSLQDCIQTSMRPEPLLLPDNLYKTDATPSSLIPRRAVLLNGGHIMVVTGSGHLLHCNVMDKGLFEWSLVCYDNRLANYCLLEPSLCRKYIALATLIGQILIFEEDDNSVLPLVKAVDITAVQGKIFSLQWLSPELILTCASLGRLEMWRLVKNTGVMELKKFHEFALPTCKERWLTAALLKDGFLVCGDRAGSIHLYHISSSAKVPCETLFRIHGRLGVSSLSYHAEDKLCSTGRDGTLRQYRIISAHHKLQHLCADRLPMEWVAVTCDSPHGPLAAGFSQSSFLVWSQRDQRILVQLPCGGGHRSWDCAVSPSTLHFIHIKEKQVHYVTCHLDHLAKPLLQSGFHTREVCCMRLVHGTKCPLLISAGEDTTMRLTAIHHTTGPETLAVLRSHISSVRALALCPLDGKEMLVVSAGGRAQMKAWLLTIKGEQDGVGIPQVGCHEVASHMLKTTGIRQRRPWREALPTVDSETRYMSLSAVAVAGSSAVAIAAGCSDGLLRMFCYDVIGQKLNHIGTYAYHNHCILSVTHLSLDVILTMATDGNVAFWDVASIVQEMVKSYTTSVADNQDSNNKPPRADCVSERYKIENECEQLFSEHHIFKDSMLTGHVCSHCVIPCDDVVGDNSICDKICVLSTCNDLGDCDSSYKYDDHSLPYNDIKNHNYDSQTNQSSSTHELIEDCDSSSETEFLSPACNDHATNNDMSPFFVCHLHQSGINSHDLAHLESDIALLVTGGDDNAITFSVFRVTTRGMSRTAEQLIQWKEDSAHSAQVTGLKLVNDLLVSTSVDQRVLVWRWWCIPSQGILKVHLMCGYCSPVADVQGLQTWGHRNNLSLCVYGKGMEILSVDMLNSEDEENVNKDAISCNREQL